MNGNCMIVQSGGPTAVINNSMVGIIDEALQSGFSGNIYGAVGGIHGLLNESFITLNHLSSKDKYQLRGTPGSALGTLRYKITASDFEIIIQVLRKNNIRYFFYIGGNGSMEVANEIDRHAKIIGYELFVIGVPKSIDNDLLGTDHSPGYGSAAKFLATAVLDVKMDMASYTKNSRLTIIETMGRHTGWLAGACSLAEGIIDQDDSQLLIYIPEVPFDIKECLHKVVRAYNENRNTIIVVSEGILDPKGRLASSESIEYDVLGRPKLGGVSSWLKEIVEQQTSIDTRIIESSIWQRSSVMLASKTDIDEAYKIGKVSWQYAKANYSGVMVSLNRSMGVDHYHIVYDEVLLSEVAGQERYVPIDWYNAAEHTMTDDFKQYAFPLIQGELFLPMENGLPLYKKVI